MKTLEEKIDHLVDKTGSIDVTLARCVVSLEEHMRRSDLLERRQDEITAEIKPLTKAHNMWAGVGKALAVLATLATILGGAWGIFH